MSFNEDLFNQLGEEIDKAKGVKGVNKKIAEVAYKEAVKANEELSTLKLKIFLLSKNGEWVDAGTYPFSQDKMENISDFVKEIVLTQIDGIENYVVGGKIKAKFSVIDVGDGNRKLIENTISIAVPKDLLKNLKEEKKERIIEQVETSILDNIEKFVEANKKFLETTVEMKEAEKKSLIEIYDQKLTLVNETIKTLKDMLLQQSKAGDSQTIAVILQLMQELQRIRDSYEARIAEIMAKQLELQKEAFEKQFELQREMFEKQARLQEEIAKKEIEDLKRKLESVSNEPKEDKTKDVAFELLKKFTDIAISQTTKDPVEKFKETINILKELKQGEDVKEQLTQTTLDLVKKKLSEDPLQDTVQKIKLFKEIMKELGSDDTKLDMIRQELNAQISRLQDMLFQLQMQNEQRGAGIDDLLGIEEERKDPLEKMLEELERFAKLKDRLERLFGNKPSATKTFADTVKEILNSPTVVEIMKVLGQMMLQHEQMKMQMMMMQPPMYGMPYGYPQQPIMRPQPPQQPKRGQVYKMPQPKVVVQPKQKVVVGKLSEKMKNKQQSKQEQNPLKEEIHNTLNGELRETVKKLKSKPRKKLVSGIVDKIMELEKEKQLLVKIVNNADNSKLLDEFQMTAIKILKEELGVDDSTAVDIISEVFQEVIKHLTKNSS